MRALFVRQDHLSGLGPVGDGFDACRYDIEELLVVPPGRFTRPDVEVTFPAPTDFDVIVPMGAPWSVYDDASIGTWVHAELEFLRSAHDAGVPVLGICFGGQALVTALGGKVERAPGPEIGWHRVDTGNPDLIEAGPWFQWHHDRWVDPPGGRSLARTALGPQVFVLGRSMALQFHPELTTSMLQGWLGHGGAELLRTLGTNEADLLARTRAEEAAAAIRTRRLVERFLSLVATAPRPGPRGRD